MHNTHLKCFLKHKVLGPLPRVSDFLHLGWHLTISISHKFPGRNAYATAVPLWEVPSLRTTKLFCDPFSSVTFYTHCLLIWKPFFPLFTGKKELAHLFTIHHFQEISLVPTFLPPVLVGLFKYSYSALADIF